MPNMTACYFITPTVESINRMLADYKDKRSPMYGKNYALPQCESYLPTAELLRPRTVRSKVAQVDEGMVARAHRDQALSELQEAAEQVRITPRQVCRSMGAC